MPRSAATGREAKGHAPPRPSVPVSPRRALGVTLFLALVFAAVVYVAVTRPVWLLTLPVAAATVTVLAGVWLYVRARREARRRARAEEETSEAVD